MKSSRLAIVAWVVAIAPVAAQGAPIDIGATMRDLRASDLPSWERDRLVADLLAAGVDGARPLLGFARSQRNELQKHLDAASDAHLQRFERAAQRVAKERLGPRELARVDELRKAILAHSRDQALTKETIETEIDPRVAELRELLVLPTDVVLVNEDGLQDSATELRREARKLAAWADAAARAAHVMRDAGVEVEGPDDAPPTALDLEGAIAEARGRAALRATLADERATKVLDANRAIAAGMDPEEAEGLARLDQLRLLLGLDVLAIDPRLCDAARDHSKDMRELGFFSHTSPVEGKTTPGQRAALFGTSASGENIARGHETGEGAIRGWWYSPGHHRNMLAGHARVGLGRSETFWTQLFGG